jgi:DNA-binding LytR/AlgR family response regulator
MSETNIFPAAAAIANEKKTCVVAEDESLFREALVAMLGEVWPNLEIVALCDDGADALDAIAEHKPDVAFLDIRMPGMTGMEVAARLAEIDTPTRIVFVTAYDQYAIDAFENGAIDYLLKPVARERLEATVKRLQKQLDAADPSHLAVPQTHLQTQQMHEMLAALAKQLAHVAGTTSAGSTGAHESSTAPPAEKLVWLTASSGRETRLIMVDDVVYFQSDNKYTVVMTAQGESLLRTPLAELVPRLDGNVFRQIHRGTVVNMREVASLTRDESGRGTMKLKGRPETLAVSLTYMPLFKNM